MENMPDRAPLVKVGDVFVERWGYDQTNIDFYQVTRVSASGQTVTLRPVEARIVDGRVVPAPDRFRRELRGSVGDSPAGFRRKVKAGWRGDPWITMTTYSGASLWDGRPQYDTIAAGDPGH